MPNCPDDLTFSSTHARKRREAARESLGEGTAQKIMAFGLFLLGAKREDIAGYLGMPMGTLLSFLTRVGTHGLDALRDRRRTRATPQPRPEATDDKPPCSVRTHQEHLQLTFGVPGSKLTIPLANTLQSRAVLFTLLDNGLLAVEEVAEALALSPRRVRDLTAAMREKDLVALIDQRKGQTQDYRFTPEIKSELVQQVAVNAITGQSTSSRAIAKGLQQRCSLDLSDRSIRWHMKKLGLTRIAQTLPILVLAPKKTPENDSGGPPPAGSDR
jgi:hypothetical protein